jgi:hypothetical protein
MDVILGALVKAASDDLAAVVDTYQDHATVGVAQRHQGFLESNVACASLELDSVALAFDERCELIAAVCRCEAGHGLSMTQVC